MMPLKLLTAFLVIELRMQLTLLLDHIQLDVHKLFKALVFSQLVATSLYCCMRVFFPWHRTFDLLLLNVMRYLLMHFSSLTRPFCTAVLQCINHFSLFGTMNKFAENKLCPTMQVINADRC